VIGIVLLIWQINDVNAQTKSKPHKFGLGLELGQWAPTNLNYDPDLASLKEVKTNPSIGFIFLKPWRYGLAFRSTIGVWKYQEEQPSQENEGVKIISILLDMKYVLIDDGFLLPYVSYGVGWFFGCGSENKGKFYDFGEETEMGVGINIGAGFDFQLSQKICAAIEFRYHYVKFNQVVVFTDNYSGPKISLALLYLF